MIQRSLTSVGAPIAFAGAWWGVAMRGLAILVATFIALSALARLRDGDFAPQATRAMPPVSVPF
jgi:hypothetical protein